ncbi:MAG TPA: hypothetical protein VGB53_09590 [Rubricoccaceae bacterium]|jgi:hypothetical protein
MPAPHKPHPAIRRGHYEVQTFLVCNVDAKAVSRGRDIPLRVVGMMPTILRVVVAGLDIEPYLVPGTERSRSKDLTSDAFVQTVAPYLREGLIDPGNGEPNTARPPVVAMETLHGLSFVQAVACLN